MEDKTVRSTSRPAARGRRRVLGFPGEAAWVWHNQIRIQRLISPLRTAALLLTAVHWFLTPHPAGSDSDDAGAVVVGATLYLIADFALVFRWPSAIRELPWGSSLLDFVLLTAWLYVTGGANSPYADLAFLGVVSATISLSWRLAAVSTVAYVVLYVVVMGGVHWLDAAYLAACGSALTFWTATTQHDRRNSLRDDLTGSFTREYATFRLNDVYDRDAFPVAVAVVDLDGFKHINDTFGHPAGDAVLIQAVRVISSAIRQGDLLARSGGDEFLLVLPRTSANTAKAIAERVRTGVGNTRFRLRRELPPVRLTASIGVAVADHAGVDRAALINTADQRLYDAKESGRNKVCL
jgi:diguanylate cyclase (GGDEF)-like protein